MHEWVKQSSACCIAGGEYIRRRGEDASHSEGLADNVVNQSMHAGKGKVEVKHTEHDNGIVFCLTKI